MVACLLIGTGLPNHNCFSSKFVKRLPDKGARIQALAERLRSLLSLHTQIDDTADMLHDMALEAEYKHRSVSSMLAYRSICLVY